MDTMLKLDRGQARSVCLVKTAEENLLGRMLYGTGCDPGGKPQSETQQKSAPVQMPADKDDYMARFLLERRMKPRLFSCMTSRKAFTSGSLHHSS